MDLFQVKPEECVAFGDQYNDIEMLQLAGTSYAMSNAAPGISYYSTYVTDSVEDVLEDILAQVSLHLPQKGMITASVHAVVIFHTFFDTLHVIFSSISMIISTRL